MDLESILKSDRGKNRELTLALLQREGRIRLAEAGPDLRIYHLLTFAGERIRICLYNNGYYEIHNEFRNKAHK